MAQKISAYLTKAFPRQHKRLAILVPVAAIVIALNVFMDLRPAPSVRGQRDAQSDVAQGKYKELGLDLGDAPELPEYARLLQERSRIKLEVVGDCYVSPEQVAYLGAYNRRFLPCL